MNNNVANKGVKLAIEKCGNTYMLAEKCKVTQPAVMKWLYINCPAERALQLEKLTGVSRELIRPDLFLKS